MKLKTLVAAMTVGLAAIGVQAQQQTGPVRIGFGLDIASAT